MTITAGPHDTTSMPRICAKCGSSYEGTRMLCDSCRIGKCTACGGPLVQTRGVEHVYRYCSLACRDKGRKGIPYKARVTVFCRTCGNPFQVQPCRAFGSKPRLYCSKECRKVGVSKNLSAVGLKLRADPTYRAKQSARTAASWLEIEKRANHCVAVRTPEYRRRRSQIAQRTWAVPGSKSGKALRAYLDSPKFQEAMKKRGPTPPIKWRIYQRPDGTTTKMRSLWEVTYATWLDLMGMPWEYEPERFELSDGRTYTPDFKVGSPLGTAFVEVHRFINIKPGDERKIEKLKLAQKELPLPLVFVGEEDMGYVRRAVSADMRGVA